MIYAAPVSNNGQTASSFLTYAAAAQSTAQSLAAGFVNVQHEWGTVFIPSLFDADQVHSNDAGALAEWNILLPALIQSAVPAGSGSSYTPSAIAITGGTIDCVSMGTKTGIQSFSVANTSAVATAVTFQVGDTRGNFKVAENGTITTPSCTGCYNQAAAAITGGTVDGVAMGTTKAITTLGCQPARLVTCDHLQYR